MKVYLYLRETEDWSKLEIENSSLSKRAKKIAFEWNQNCSISWQDYRNQIKAKALSTWNLPIVEELDVLKLNNEDAIIPIDDDDWLHSDIGLFVESEIGKNDVLQWTQIVNCSAKSRGIHKWDFSKSVFCTSDHALRIGKLRELDRESKSKVLKGHDQVQHKLFYSRRIYVPECMSCYNWHPGSHSCLTFANFNELGIMKKYKRGKIPKWAMWAKSHINWLDDLIDSVEAKEIKVI